jgi:chromosome partitioning protein
MSNKHVRKIAVVGFKGGIGKTTTCVNLGAALAHRGHRVLLVDTDTQANVGIALGIKDKEYTLTEVLTGQVPAQQAIVPARPNLDLLPSDISLFKAQQRLVLEMAREEFYLRAFEPIEGYEYHILDCAPSLTLLTVNALFYVEEVYVPVSMEVLALAGARQFTRYLRELSRILGRQAAIRLLIPTMYDATRETSGRILHSLKSDYRDKVTHPIRRDVRLSDAPAFGKTIFEYNPHSLGALDYARLAERVAQMGPLKADG